MNARTCSVLLGLLAVVAGPSALAVPTWTHVCTFANNTTSARAIAWNTITGEAQIQHFDGVWPGRVARKLKHTATGYKFNLVFQYGDRFGANEAEYIVFPVEGKGWRAGGAQYARDSGGRYIFSVVATEVVNCVMP